MTTTNQEPPPAGSGGTGPGRDASRTPRAPKTREQKLAEALGLGGPVRENEGEPHGTTIPPPVPTHEPKKAYPSTPKPAGAPTGTAAAAGTPFSFPPPAAAARPRRERAPWAPVEMVRIASGAFLYGEQKTPQGVPAFSIDAFPVTNADYERFVGATGHRPPLYWKAGTCPADLFDHPVVGVDYFDAVAYARWAGKDLPYEDEWERAARGTDGRTYPWGDDPDLCANTARTGLRSTIPVGFHARNRSPDGVRDMVGNVWQLTHSPAPGGGLVVRGGSWYDFALYAKAHFRFAARPDARNGTIGFRCVRREAPRLEVARAVPEAEVDAEIAKRRGASAASPAADAATWSAERRDLVPDVRRLTAFLDAHAEEAREEEERASPQKPAVKRAFAAPAPGPVPAAAPRPPPPPAPVAPPPAPRAPAAAPVPSAATSPAPPPPPPKAAAPPPPKAAVPTSPPVAASPASTPAKPPPKPVPPPESKPAPPPVARAPSPPPPAPPAPVAPSPRPVPSARPAVAAPASSSTGVSPETAPEDERPSRLRLAVLVMAFLAAATGLVVVLHNATKGTSPSVAGTEDAAVSALGFPPIAAADHLDGAYPSLFGRGSAEAALDPLQKGGVLFVFADPTQETGLESARVAIDVHRRLRAREVRVVLVVPRGAFAGNRTDEASILEALGHAGVVTDVEVLLDPSDERGAGHWRRTVFHVFDEAGAVLWEEGREAWRVTPPDPGGALQLAWLKSAVLRLWEEYPRKEVPPPPPTPAAVVPGKPMPSDEEVEAGGEENPPPGQR